MILSENALYIKYIRLKEAGDLPHEYPYTVPALAGFSGLRFRRPVTFIVGENGMGKSTLLEAIAVIAVYAVGYLVDLGGDVVEALGTQEIAVARLQPASEHEVPV